MIMVYIGLCFSDVVFLVFGNISNIFKGLYYSLIMKKNECRVNKEILLLIYVFFYFKGEEESWV